MFRVYIYELLLWDLAYGWLTYCYGLHVGIEARGFLFGPSIALGIGAKFVPLRKPRKLPGNLVEC